jgi:bifunctional non-homologous end joining protein LigD
VAAVSLKKKSTPLGWDEVQNCRPEEFTVATVLQRFAEQGDVAAGIDDAAGSLDPLLALAETLGPAEKAPAAPDGSGRRRSSMPLIEIARAKTKEEAIAGLDVWRSRHPEVVASLEPADVLVDAMRGTNSLWYRVRLNLQHVPEALRPDQGPLEVDYDPWAGRS